MLQKTIKSLFFLLVTFCLYGFGGNNKETINHPTSLFVKLDMMMANSHYLKGKVVRLEQIHASPDFKRPTKIIHIFDAQGKLIEERIHSPAKSSNYAKTNIFYSNNQAISHKKSNPHGKVFTTTDITYNEVESNGVAILKDHTRSLDFKTTFSFSQKKRIMKIVRFDKSNKPYAKFKYILNNNDQLIGHQDEYGMVYDSYTFNPKGYPSTINMSRDDAKIGVMHFSYKYDDTGNWIKRTQTLISNNGNERVIQIADRKITYSE